MIDVAQSERTSQRSTERLAAWWMAVVFVGSNLYYFHRYAFRYNSDDTSPTYVDTPFAWQAAKYFLMLAATGAAWVSLWWSLRTPGRRVSGPWRDFDLRPTGGFAPLAAVFVVYGLLVSLVGASPSNDNFGDLVVVYFCVPVVLLATVVPLGRPSWTVYGWAGAVLVGYHVAFAALQLVLFVVADRLPALAYENSLTRFGGGLDDPNGFGVMLILPLVLGVSMWDSVSRRLLLVVGLLLLAGLLFLTLSFSAGIGCVVAFVTLAVLRRHARLLGAIAATLAVFGVIGWVWSYTRSVVEDKMDSALTRFDFGGSGSEFGVADFFTDSDVVAFLFGAPGTRYFSENSYLLLLTNFGMIGVGVVVVLVTIALQRGVTTARAARKAGAMPLASLYEAFVAFIAGFAVAALGVPYFEVFPVNMLFWIVAVLAVMGPNIVGSEQPEVAADPMAGRSAEFGGGERRPGVTELVE